MPQQLHKRLSEEQVKAISDDFIFYFYFSLLAFIPSSLAP